MAQIAQRDVQTWYIVRDEIPISVFYVCSPGLPQKKSRTSISLHSPVTKISDTDCS